MIRQPDIATMAKRLQAVLAASGVEMGHQKALNAAAELLGYKNLAHYRRENGTPKADASPASAAEAPQLVFVTDGEPMPGAQERALWDLLGLPSRHELAESLEWVTRRYESTLSGLPVRDADEALLRANTLLRKVAAAKVPAPTIVSLQSTSRAA